MLQTKRMGGTIHFLPRPRQNQRGLGLRKTVASIGRFARPFLKGVVKELLPLGLNRLKNMGSNAIRLGGEMLNQAAATSKGGGRLVSGLGDGSTNYYPFINKDHSPSTVIPASHPAPATRKARKKKKGGRKKSAIVGGRKRGNKKGGAKARKTTAGGRRRKKVGGRRKKVGGRSKKTGGRGKKTGGRAKKTGGRAKKTGGRRKRRVGGGSSKKRGGANKCGGRRKKGGKNKPFSVFN